MFTAANVSKKTFFPQKKWIRVSGYRFRYQLTCPLCTGVFLDFLGNALQLFLGPLTQKQLTCLSSCRFRPWSGICSLFWGIDSANNHSHISKPHPLKNTDTLGGRLLSMASHPTLSKCNWFLECTPNLPAHPRASSMMRSSGRSWDTPFSPPFCYQCGLWFEPYWGLEIKMLGRPGR